MAADRDAKKVEDLSGASPPSSNPIVADLWHLEDFLAHILRTEVKRETIAAYRLVKRQEGAVKKTFDEWLADFRKFEQTVL